MSRYYAALFCLCAVPAFAGSAQAQDLAVTASGHAYAEVRRAIRQDDVLHLEVQFTTDYAGYAGEVIYDDIPAERVDGLIYVMFGDQTFPLWRQDGQVGIAEELKLGFNYDPEKNPRVGKWEADFVAPTADIVEATLLLPNVGPIGPFQIRDR